MIKKVMWLGVLFMIVLVSSEASIYPDYNVCCEKTLDGAWCQNTLEENCDLSDGLRTTPASCEATSFCKKGCCMDSSEGICMINTPQRVCEEEGGVWEDDASCNIAQCQLGCCILGNEGSFVTLTRCKRLSSFYGLTTDFRTSITEEFECISIANSQDEGACISETDEFDKNCVFTTRAECPDESEFFENRLCTDPKLGTDCERTTETMCIPGENEVYFKDSCGNRANIYDASKIQDNLYWSEVFGKDESCDLKSNLGNAKTCGNCDFFSGSICGVGRATYGDYICKDLTCEVEIDGEKVEKKNGESWCYYDGNTGEGSDAVGSAHYRYLCMNGEVQVEMCDSYRNEVCIEDEVETDGGVFGEAACRINRWRDCLDQENQKDCENGDMRDCYWVEGINYLGAGQGTEEDASSSSSGTTSDSSFSAETQEFSGTTGNVITGYSIFGGDDDDEEESKKSTVGFGGGICLPDVPPGFKFWEEGDAESICGMINAVCVVEYEKGLLDSERTCVKHCECIDPSYAPFANEVCASLGDCGAYVNYVGEYTDDGIQVLGNGDEIDWQKHVGNGILSSVRARAGVKYE